MGERNKHALIKSAFWSLFGQIGYMVIILITNAILARFLTKSEFGQLSIVMFFIIISNIISEGGVGGALVRKEHITNKDYSTAFLFNFFLSIIMFLLLLILSGNIASFYNDIELKKYLIISSSILLINSFQVVPNAKLIIFMKFRERSLYRLLSMSLASIFGITFAYFGNGVISAIIIQIIYTFTFTFCLILKEKIFYKIEFSRNSLFSLYKFGVNTSITSLLSAIFDNIYQVILGKYFNYSQAGLYYQSKRLQDVPTNLINTILQGVIYSEMSKKQKSKKLLSSLLIKTTDYVAAVLGLAIIFSFLFGEYLLEFVYGKNWIDGAFYLRLLLIASFFYVQDLTIRVLFKTIDKTNIILKIDLIKKAIQIITIFMGIYNKSVFILLLGLIVSNAFSYYISYKISEKYVCKNKRVRNTTIVLVLSLFLALSSDLIKHNYNDLTFNALYFMLSFVTYLYALNKLKVLNLCKETEWIVKTLKI